MVAPPASAATFPTGSPQQLYVAGLYGDYLTNQSLAANQFAVDPTAAVLGTARSADSTGSSYYVPQLGLATTGTPPAASAMNAVSTQFINSSEFRNDLVVTDYMCYLGRTGDAAGLAYWDALKGVTINSLSAAMLSGSEAFNGTAATNLGTNSCPNNTSQSSPEGNGNFDTWLTAVYWNLLGRAPDAAGKTYYDGLYVKGTSLSTIATSFLNSTEYETLQINNAYTHFLRRAGDSSGVAYYVGLMKGGAGITPEQMLAAITSSTEYWTFTQGANNV